MGRKLEYTEEVADIICERLASGESLNAMCKTDDLPSISTVFKWLSLKPEFADKYARARETQADVIFDEILSIADTEDDTQKARVRIDARKWMAGKMRPKVYGEKVVVGGDDTLDPIRTEENGENVLALKALVASIGERIGDSSDTSSE